MFNVGFYSKLVYLLIKKIFCWILLKLFLCLLYVCIDDELKAFLVIWYACVIVRLSV